MNFFDIEAVYSDFVKIVNKYEMSGDEVTEFFTFYLMVHMKNDIDEEDIREFLRMIYRNMTHELEYRKKGFRGEK